MTAALQVTVTAPIASFRNPLYHGLQVGLPCPPPSTVGGLLAAAAGGWDRVPATTRFAMTFRAEGRGTDLETYHPLAAPGTDAPPTIKDRDFLAHTTLTLWLTENLDMWHRVLRAPVWPLHLGRSQDLVSVRSERVQLRQGRGTQGHAVVPDDLPGAVGTRMRLTTAVAHEHDRRTRWDGYRYAQDGTAARLDADAVSPDGHAVALLPATHPDQLLAA